MATPLRTIAVTAALVVIGVPAAAQGLLPGDLNDNGTVDAGDATLLHRHLAGALTLSEDQLGAADVGPLSGGLPAPDNEVDGADLVVLLRAVSGALPPPATPTLDSLPTTTNDNPLQVTGTADAGSVITIYSNGIFAAATSPLPGGAFSLNVPLFDGVNQLQAFSSTVAGTTASSTDSIEYQNNISMRTDLAVTADTAWTPGASGDPYVFTSGLSIPQDVTLWLMPGTVLEFQSGALTVQSNGTLLVRGMGTNPVVLRSDNPTAGEWTGVQVQGSGAAEIVSAEIRYATWGVRVLANSDVTIGPGNTLESNQTGIRIETASPQILGNIIQSNNLGIDVFGAGSPLIYGQNRILSNSQSGIKVEGGTPVVNDNTIASNTFNFSSSTAGAPVSLNMERNWWGSAIPADIASSIDDRLDSPGRSAIVDFVPFLDQEDGVPQGLGSVFVGAATDASDPVNATGDLLLAGVVYVPETTSSGPGVFTVPAGRTVKAIQSARIEVDGQLLLGESGGPLTTIEPDTGVTDWGGIQIGPTSVGTEIHDVLLTSTDDGAILVNGTDVTVSGVQISDFSLYGIKMDNGAGGLIAGCSITGAALSGTGITLDRGSSPLIQDNTITGTEIAIAIDRGSSPTIDGGNDITGNDRGIQIDGTEFAGVVSNPLITGNTIASNATGNLELVDFPETLLIDATANYWGTTNAQDIIDAVVSLDEPPVPVDVTDYLDAAGGDPFAPGVLTLTYGFTGIARAPALFDPNLGESSTIQFDALAPGSWEVRIYDEADYALGGATAVRMDSGTAVVAGPQSVPFNGRLGPEATDPLVPDGAYVFEIDIDYGGGATFTYQPVNIGAAVGGAVSGQQKFNAHENVHWKGAWTAGGDRPFRLAVNVTPPGGTEFVLFDGIPALEGSVGAFSFDGRDPATANIVPAGETVVATVATTMFDFATIVRGVSPRVSGVPHGGISPAVLPVAEVRSEPFLIFPTYDQVSQIAFCLSHDAQVTIKVLKPGFIDPQNPAGLVATLLDDQPRSAVDCNTEAPHTVEWNALDPSVTNQLADSATGTYTFTIEARNPTIAATDPNAADYTTLYRGSIQVQN